VVLLMQLLDDLRFVESVGAAQVARALLSGLEGKHVIELVIGWPPKGAPEWEAQLFAATLPVIVELGGEVLEVGQAGELLVVALDEGHDPPLAARQHIVPARLPLQLHQCPLQELLRQPLLSRAEPRPQPR
jgi:hypothetical protein